MLSSPGCWARYGDVLAREYSNPELTKTHRLSVDTYAVQHHGYHDQRAIRSVGLRLARLMLQLDRPSGPRETNEVMLGLSGAKATIEFLDPPKSFTMTAADIPLEGPFQKHIEAVQAWACSTWQASEDHHDYIRNWTKMALDSR